MPARQGLFRVFLLLLLFACSHASPRAQEDAFALGAESLKDGRTIELDGAGWRCRAGDDAAWAARDFDDGDWRRVGSSRWSEEDLHAIGWNGRAWCRLSVRADEGLETRALTLRAWHQGASEIYLDAKLLRRFGQIDADADEEYNPRGLYVPVVLEGGAHTIAVRYSFAAARDVTRGRGRWLARHNYRPGFALALAPGDDAAFKLESRLRADRLHYALIGLLFALALVHFLLFIFYRRAPGNLFYSLFVTGLASTLWLASVTTSGHFSATANLVADIARENLQTLGVLALLAFLYVEFAGRVSRVFWLLAAACLAGIVLHSMRFSRLSLFTPAMLIVTLALSLRLMARALAERRAGAWIIAVGIGVLVVGVGVNIAVGHNLVALPRWLSELNLNLTVLSVPVAVSIYLARNFARTNHHLEAQLAQVRELSARELEHERTEAELRLQHEKERAENERRARELEEARQLQLSMLPKELPRLPNMEIAAYMKPATEVGGDYYDFHVGEDGTLTVAVGDATGHGLKAGTMVTAMKGLFGTLAPQADIPQIFRESNRVLKGMRMRGLFMAFLMFKVRGDALRVCCAGLPPMLVYRAARGAVEEVALKSVPLGCMTKAVFDEQQLRLAAGDCVLVMSDGFPERFNEAGEMLGYDRAAKILREVAAAAPQEIVNRFVEIGDEWAGGRALDDDVTFVVLKMKGEG